MTMMNTTPAHQPTQSMTAEETLTEVRKRLVQIRASVAESPGNDPQMIPWVYGELLDLIRYIRNAQAEQ